MNEKVSKELLEATFYRIKLKKNIWIVSIKFRVNLELDRRETQKPQTA